MPRAAILIRLLGAFFPNTDAGTMVNTIALIVTATSGIKIAFNANPLIKLDGYYLLGDLEAQLLHAVST